MIITGYRIHSTDFTDVETEIRQAKKRLEKLSNQIYQRLLGEEAGLLYDQLSLNVLQQPEGVSFLDWVVNNLNLKIQIAQQNGAATDYNFNVLVFCMALDGYTYLRVICPNKKLLKSFDKLEAYNLSATECMDKNNKKTQVWQKLCGNYDNNAAVFTLNLTPEPKPDKEKIKIPSKKERCEIQSRHDLLNHYLRQVSGGDNIPPYLLMPCMDQAMGMLLSEEATVELKERTNRLNQILQNETEIMKKLFPDDNN